MLNMATPSLADLPAPISATVLDQTPAAWFIVFHEEPNRHWFRRLAVGRFRHVSCFGWVPSADRWIFFDPSLERACIRLVPDEVAFAEPLHVFDLKAGYFGGDIGKLQRLGPIVKVDARADRAFVPNILPVRRCVRDVARVIGVNTWAISPDAFFLACLRAGGEVITRPRQGRVPE